ncbi:uncharacterized protein KY384_009241 [Bacidia gigantensis]|uniref:uncharacterized protein n=1 Tax=Bacidia gigantensis TaxID=2732470 RepID=UPI001D05683C|nr:uncharacterized protein KY384_009241 [Bacidia gigantensis]KAG8525597.1 hypothetical protein KY384_009241 [Bacidia gigantensis]
MGMILAMNHPAPGPSPNPDKWGAPTPTPNLPSSISQNLVAVVGLAGIYDFSACRDAHVEWRDVYEEFITAAFGAEELGGWERGDLVLRDGVRVVVMGYSEEDELVEVAQAEAMERALEGREKEREGKGAVVKRVEVKGGHDEMVEQGVEIARCVGVALEVVLDPAGGSSENC